MDRLGTTVALALLFVALLGVAFALSLDSVAARPVDVSPTGVGWCRRC
jgi:hypothetical protein